MTLEDMEATNVCRSLLGDNSSRAPLGDIPNLEHPSQMTPVPVPGNCEHNFLLLIALGHTYS